MSTTNSTVRTRSTIAGRTGRRLVGSLAVSAVLATSVAGAASAAPGGHCTSHGAHASSRPSVKAASATTSTTKAVAVKHRRPTATQRAAATTSTHPATGGSAVATSSRAGRTTRTLASAATSSVDTTSSTTLRYASRTTISTAGLSPDAVTVLKAINAQFPQVTSIGGLRSGSDAEDHATGHALDLMIPNANTAAGKALGNEIAAYLLAHHGELGVHYVIWEQHIWNVTRASEGWRAMADRGSTTANHDDHVHVSVY